MRGALPLVTLVGLGACAGAPARAPAAAGPIPAEATQLVLVTTPSWDATAGKLARFERAPGGAWRRAGETVPIVVGRGGLGWGAGIHGDGAPAGRGGPAKVEGDGRAPAGVFRLGHAYGYDEAAPAGARLPYAALSPSWVCVDDPASPRYNRVFDAAGVTPDWKSAEVMRRADELYRLVVVVEHNAGARPGAGSCIFLHVWDGPQSTTVGCTALERDRLAALLGWLAPDAVYVALPEGELSALHEAWALPQSF